MSGKNKKNILYYLPFLIQLVITVNGLSQGSYWTSKGFGPAFRHHNASQILNTGRIVSVGGWLFNDAITTIHLSDDTATTWDIRLDFVNAMINDVHFPTSLIGYAVGNAGRIFKTTDAGHSWTNQPLTGNDSARNYYGVYFTDALNGIAVGGNKTNDSIQTILKTTDGGNNWTVITDNLGSMLEDVMFIDTNNGIAVGDKGKILITNDGGTTWTTSAVTGNLTSREFSGVHFFDANTGIVVGGNTANDSIQTIIKTTDGGQNWNIEVDSIASMLRTVCFYSATEGYTAGDDGVIKFTNDQGITWTRLNIAGNDSYDIYDINFLNRGFGVACGQFGKTLIYRDTTINPPTIAIPNPFTVINSNSVQINGIVNANSLPASVDFEYGTTPMLGITLPMTPSTVNANGVPVSLSLTGLLPGTVYYGRIKANNTSGAGYSSVFIFVTNAATGPNFDFEQWNSFSYDVLQNWTTAGQIQRVSSYDGSFAAKAKAINNQAPGAIVYANVANNSGGNGPDILPLPYSGGRPDTLMFYAKYDIDVNDSALVMMNFKYNGNFISNTLYHISGSSGGVFQQIKIPVNYSTTDTPDSLMLLFLSTNYFGGTISALSEITLDNVTFIGANSQLPNNDMELWNIVNRNQAVSWYSQDDNNNNATDSSFVTRTTDAYSGSYALELRNNIASGNFAYLHTSQTNGPPLPDFPVAFRYSSLKGYYKYFPDANDTININITMFYHGSPIGWGQFQDNDSTSAYTLFNVPINYFGFNTPDSASISVSIQKNHGTGIPGNSSAIIDAFYFEGITVSIDENEQFAESVNIFPNPASENLTIEFSQSSNPQIEVFDITGRLQMKNSFQNIQKANLDITNLSPQVYIVKIQTENQLLTRKFIKTK